MQESPNESESLDAAVVAYQQWLNGERGPDLGRHSGMCASTRPQVRNCAPGNLEIPRGAIAPLRSGPSDHPGMTTLSSILGRKDPVAAGLQADDLAGLQFPVPGGV